MKILVLIFISLFLIQGCATPEGKIVFPKVVEVKSEVVLSDLQLRLASNIYIVDSLLIIQDVQAQEKYLKYYDLRRNELLIEFGQKGKGPEQLITPYLFYVDSYSSKVYLYDPNLLKMHVFDVAQLSEKPDTIINLELKQEKNTDRVFYLTQPSANIIYGMGLLRKGYLAAVDTKEGKAKLFWKIPTENKQFK
ncbi:MAG: BF3164 family lipoprotein [Mangrovibacterium sp.]